MKTLCPKTVAPDDVVFFLFLFLFSFTTLSAAEIELIAIDGHRASLSRDGQLVAFESKSDVYVFDRRTKELERVQRKDPRHANGGPDLSGNGNLLAFHSYRTAETEMTAQRLADVRVLNRRRQTQELMTSAYGDSTQNGEALFPHLALNGRYVLFTSNATNLRPVKTEAVRAAYLFDRFNNTLELVSKNINGVAADRPVGDPRLSQNGRYVFFKSAATNLMGKLPDTHLSSHLYRVDRWDPRVSRVDDEDRGFDQTRWATGRYVIDDEGDTVVFEGRDRKEVDFDKRLETTTLFLFDASTPTIQPLLPMEYQGKAHSPTLSADGRYVGFAMRPKGLMVLDRETNELRRMNEAVCENVVFSADGRVIAFESNNLNLPMEKHVFQAATRPGVLNLYVTDNPFF